MEPWEMAYRRWRKLADCGYGSRCNTPGAMHRADERIRRAKAEYERLLAKSKKHERPKGARRCLRRKP